MGIGSQTLEGFNGIPNALELSVGNYYVSALLPFELRLQAAKGVIVQFSFSSHHLILGLLQPEFHCPFEGFGHAVRAVELFHFMPELRLHDFFGFCSDGHIRLLCKM